VYPEARFAWKSIADITKITAEKTPRRHLTEQTHPASGVFQTERTPAGRSATRSGIAKAGATANSKKETS
jgi:hypothetical protein